MAQVEPSIASIDPSNGPSLGGTLVSIAGVGLIDATTVVFGDTAAPAFTVVDDGTLTALSPPQSDSEAQSEVESVSIVVTTAEGTTPQGDTSQFTYTAASSAICSCTVKSFPTPTVRPHPNPNYGGLSFEVSIKLDNSAGACGCLEYRQYVRGTYKINGIAVPMSVPDPNNSGPDIPVPDRTGAFVEDGIVASKRGTGTNPHLGHRDDANNIDSRDRYTPNRASGPNYHAADSPGTTLTSGDKWDMDLEFEGRVVQVDRTTNPPTLTLVQAQRWFAKGNGTIP